MCAARAEDKSLDKRQRGSLEGFSEPKEHPATVVIVAISLSPVMRRRRNSQSRTEERLEDNVRNWEGVEMLDHNAFWGWMQDARGRWRSATKCDRTKPFRTIAKVGDGSRRAVGTAGTKEARNERMEK